MHQLTLRLKPAEHLARLLNPEENPKDNFLKLCGAHDHSRSFSALVVSTGNFGLVSASVALYAEMYPHPQKRKVFVQIEIPKDNFLKLCGAHDQSRSFSAQYWEFRVGLCFSGSVWGDVPASSKAQSFRAD